jgi:hypothetical protein
MVPIFVLRLCLVAPMVILQLMVQKFFWEERRTIRRYRWFELLCRNLFLLDIAFSQCVICLYWYDRLSCMMILMLNCSAVDSCQYWYGGTQMVPITLHVFDWCVKDEFADSVEVLEDTSFPWPFLLSYSLCSILVVFWKNCTKSATSNMERREYFILQSHCRSCPSKYILIVSWYILKICITCHFNMFLMDLSISHGSITIKVYCWILKHFQSNSSFFAFTLLCPLPRQILVLDVFHNFSG